MAASPSDLFGFLRDKIPFWISSLDKILRDSIRLQAQHTAGASSFETIESETEILHLRDGDLQKVLLVPYRSGAPFTRQTSSTDYQSRPTLSIGSDGAPVERNGYRARNAIVVSYDSNAQISLQEIVAGVSEAQDTIRRIAASQISKMQRPTRAFPRIANSDTHESDDNSEKDEFDEEMLLAQIRMRRNCTTRPVQQHSKGEDVSGSEQQEALEQIRPKLDLVQNLCADSAFQLLRDGNCFTEASQAVKALEAVLRVAKSAISASRAEEIVEQLKSSIENAESKAAITNPTPKSTNYHTHDQLLMKLPYSMDADWNQRPQWLFEATDLKS